MSKTLKEFTDRELIVASAIANQKYAELTNEINAINQELTNRVTEELAKSPTA